MDWNTILAFWVSLPACLAFCEDAPDIYIVVAGSLLGVLNMADSPFPTGKVDAEQDTAYILIF